MNNKEDPINDETGEEELTSVEKFRFMQDRCYELFKKKNSQYGDSIGRTGVLGAAVELVGIVYRIFSMVIKNKTHGREHKMSLRDVFSDIHNYSTIALMMLEDDNWDGVW
jgi:hypothetical protein